MEKQKKSYGKTALIVLLLIVTVASLVLATYAWAKYTTVESGTATADVAKWNVTLDGVTTGNNMFKKTFKHVVDQKIAPGTSGEFEITIDPGSTEVCIEYAITLDEITYKKADQTVMTDTIKHLKFYATCSEDGKYSNPITTGTAIEALKGTIDLTTHEATPGQLENNEPVKKKIYWVWPYDLTDATTKNIVPEEKDSTSYDAEDTKIGEGAITSMEVDFTVAAWQVQPTK